MGQPPAAFVGSGQDLLDEIGHILAHFAVVTGEVERAVTFGDEAAEDDLREPAKGHKEDAVPDPGRHEHGFQESAVEAGHAFGNDLKLLFLGADDRTLAAAPAPMTRR